MCSVHPYTYIDMQCLRSRNHLLYRPPVLSCNDVRKCVDIHRSGKRTPSGPVKGATGGKVKRVLSCNACLCMMLYVYVVMCIKCCIQIVLSYIHRWERAQVLCQHPSWMKRVFLIHDCNTVYIAACEIQ